MTEQLLVFPDVTSMAITYLREWFQGAHIDTALPAGPLTGLAIVVVDVGGAGERFRGFDDLRLTIEVSHPDRDEAHDQAQIVYSLLRRWPTVASGIYWRGTIQRPTWYPDDDTDTPRYKMSVALMTRGSATNINPAR